LQFLTSTQGSILFYAFLKRALPQSLYAHFYSTIFMQVYIEREKKTVTVDASSVKELLSTLEIVPEDVLVVKNNTIVTEDEALTSDDDIKLLSVVSGG
jgi:sulfur carrier protein ThiS